MNSGRSRLPPNTEPLSAAFPFSLLVTVGRCGSLALLLMDSSLSVRRRLCLHAQDAQGKETHSLGLWVGPMTVTFLV